VAKAAPFEFKENIMSQVLNHLGSICSGFPSLVSGPAASYTFSSALPSSFGLGKAVPSGRNLSDLATPFQCLDVPGGGLLNGQEWSAIATGGCTAPAGGGTVNVALVSNTFSTVVTAPGSADDVRTLPYSNPRAVFTSVDSFTKIVVTSQVLATLPIAQTIDAGPTQWSLEADFSGDGKIDLIGISTRGAFTPPGQTTIQTEGSGILSGTFLIVVGGVTTTGVLVPVSSWNAWARPALQLSMAIIFGNSADIFQGSMTCFEVSR